MCILGQQIVLQISEQIWNDTEVLGADQQEEQVLTKF